MKYYLGYFVDGMSDVPITNSSTGIWQSISLNHNDHHRSFRYQTNQKAISRFSYMYSSMLNIAVNLQKDVCVDYLKLYRDSGVERSCGFVDSYADLEPNNLRIEFRSNNEYVLV